MSDDEEVIPKNVEGEDEGEDLLAKFYKGEIDDDESGEFKVNQK
tara:strand:+ start:550 stop:681 length:132 start_codon:yes stop_codon:yes gene_type:complete